MKKYLFLLVLAALASSAMATDTTWKTDYVGYWAVGSNWNTGAVPTSSDLTYLEWPGTTIIDSGDKAAQGLCIGYYNWYENPILNVTGGTLTVGSGISGFWGLTVGYGSNTTGTLNLSGGTIHALGNMFVGGYSGASGTVNITGGELDTNGYLVMGQDSAATGHVNLNAGLIKCGNISSDALSLMNITQGALAVWGDSSGTIQALINANHITAYSGTGTFHFDYNNINPGYTTVWATPEPVSMLLLGLGGMILSAKRRK